MIDILTLSYRMISFSINDNDQYMKLKNENYN